MLHEAREEMSLAEKLAPSFLDTKKAVLLTGEARAKDGVSPGIEPGTTRNIDLEFSRMTNANLPKRVSYR